MKSIDPREAEDIANLSPLPELLPARAAMRRHVQAILTLAVDWGMDKEAAMDWLNHYNERLGIMQAPSESESESERSLSTA